MKLVCRDRVVSLERVAIMGVLNVTPDSFSDGGLWLDAEAAVAHGVDMAGRGAAIIDVGGESTRPGAEPVPLEEELRRVLPVIRALASHTDAVISIDTRKPEVAQAALEVGAALVNDTAGEEADPAMDRVVAQAGAAVCVMHSRGTPATMRNLTSYADVVADVGSFLARRIEELTAAGVEREAVTIDPGIGFAKAPEQNLELLRRLDELVAIGPPVLIGTSRKSFIGHVLGTEVDERLEGSLATEVWAVIKGARIVRVHDVEQTVRAVRMIEAIVHGWT
jgi:dihydropteroate synthase